jgi:hypothetical protein
MRRWRSRNPQGPSTASRFDAMARRILKMVKKKKVVNVMVIGHSVHAGKVDTAHLWNRYQNSPVT